MLNQSINQSTDTCFDIARLVLCSLQTDLNPDPSSLPFILQRLDRDGSVLKGPPGYQVSTVSIGNSVIVFLATVQTKIIVNATVISSRL